MEPGEYCSNCDLKLDDVIDVNADERVSCPNCGSTVRKFRESGTVTVVTSVTAQLVSVETAEESESGGRVLPTEQLQEFTFWYETTDGGVCILYLPVEGSEQKVPFFVGDGEDPDTAAMAVAEEFLERLNRS